MRFQTAVLVLVCAPAVGFCADPPGFKFDPKRAAEEKVLLPNLRAWHAPRNPDLAAEVACQFLLPWRDSADDVGASAFSPTASHLAIGAGSQLRIVDLATGRLHRAFPPVGNFLGHLLDYSPDGKRIACLSPRGDKVRVHDVETTALVAELDNNATILHLAFSADGSTLAAVHEIPFRVVTWKTKDWKPGTLPLADRTNPTWAVSRSGALLAHSSSLSGRKIPTDAIDIWNIATGESRTFKTKFAIHALAFGPDDKTLYVAAGSGAADETDLGAIDLATGAEKTLFKVRGDRVTGYGFGTTPDGKYLMLQSAVGTVRSSRLIEVATGKERWSGPLSTAHVEFSPGGAMMATAGSGLTVHSVEDMLNPQWADLEAKIAAARAENLVVRLNRDSVRVGNQFNIGPAGLAAIVKTLPEATRVGLKVGRAGPESLAAFGDLKHLREVGFASDAALTDDKFKGLPPRPNVESLDLQLCPKLTAAALAHVAKFKGLHRFDLSDNAWVTDDALAELAGMTELRQLSLARTKVTGAGLKHLTKLTKLEKLDLEGVRVSDGGLAALAPLTGVTDLNLRHPTGNELTDAGLRHLKAMTGLRVLNLGGAKKVTGSGFAELTCLPKLEILQLSGSGVTDANLAHLAACAELRVLEIENTKLQGSGLSHLKGCTRLTRLSIRLAPIDDKGYEAIAELTQLHALKLPRGAKTSALAPLKALKNLDELDLIETSIGRDGETHLRQMKQLRLLTLSSGLSGSDLGVSALRKALPTTHVVPLPR